MTAYFQSRKHVRRLIDRTVHCPGAELNCEETSHYVSWLEDLHTVKTNYFPGLINLSTQNDATNSVRTELQSHLFRKDGKIFTICPQCIFSIHYFLSQTSLLSMLPYDVLQQGLQMNVVPYGIETTGTMSIVSLRPRYPTEHLSAFRISKNDECLIVKDWTKIVNDRRQVIGGSKEKRSPRLGDRFICMLQLDEGGELHMFYVILPEREQQE